MKICNGTRVKILQCRKYKMRYTGKIGTVERGQDVYPIGGRIGVRIDDYENEKSSYGLFWFEADELEIIESEEKIIMLSGYRLAGVSFVDGTNQSTVYTYALYDEEIAVDDMVVVKTAHHGFAIAKVITLDEGRLGKVRYDREIICKVDMSAYECRKERAIRAAAIKQEMDAKVKELQSQAIYEMLSEKDPALKALFDEYKTLLN